MKRILALLMSAAILTVVSCQKETPQPTPEPDPEPVPELKGIHFCNVKTDFAKGSEFGLFIGSPINKSNIKLTVSSDGALVPAEDLYWGEGQSSSSSFLSYTPYNAEYTGTYASFSVSQDQSVKNNVEASDLLCAVTSASPADSTVNFSFQHKMASVQLYFDCRVNSKITKVELLDVCTSCNFSLTNGEISSESNKQTISCYDATDYWEAIFVPQSAKLTIKVTLANGKEYTKEAGDEQQFQSGKVYSTDKNAIVIEDDTPKSIKMVFSVSDWTDGGQLNFNGKTSKYTYYTLAELAATAGTTQTNFSNAFVTDVVVTKVYKNNVHIEDSTGALLVYMVDHGLVEGNLINGPISGTIVLYDGSTRVTDASKAYAELTAIDVSEAIVTSVKEENYPLTEITIAQYLANSKPYFNRRVLFKEVSVDSGISSKTQSGTISQDGSSLTIFNKSKAAEIASGDAGDLIAFPTIHKSTLQALVYTTDQFQAGLTEDNAFTRTSVMGSYSSTNTESPVAIRAYQEGADQFSYSKGSESRQWCMFNLDKGTYVTLDLASSKIAVGMTLDAKICTDGTNESRSLKVTKKESSKAWLEDKTNNVGYIIAVQ